MLRCETLRCETLELVLMLGTQLLDNLAAVCAAGHVNVLTCMHGYAYVVMMGPRPPICLLMFAIHSRHLAGAQCNLLWRQSVVGWDCR